VYYCTTVKIATQKEKVCIAKKRKWNYDYIACGIYRTKEEMLNPYPSAHCLFCKTVFGSSNLVPGHLKNILNHCTILIKISGAKGII